MGVTLRLVPVSEPHARILAEDDTLLEAVLAAERGEDFDQAGLGLHFMLCGSTWGKDLPQGTLFAGGAEGGADFGKGPAEFSRHKKRSAFMPALASSLRTHFGLATMRAP